MFVSEDFKIDATRNLLAFQNDAETELAFPPSLTKEERKYLHGLCTSMGLSSKSQGVGMKRHLVVFKDKKKQGANDLQFHLSHDGFQTASSFLGGLSKLKAPEPPLSFSVAPAHSLDNDAFDEGSIFSSGPTSPPRLGSVPPALQETKKKLPANRFKDEILDMLKSNSVILVSGETGCGKSTQVPQYIMEDAAARGRPCRVLCSQPRRLAAMSLASRVAEEWGCGLGDTVGYSIRLDSKVSRNTSLVYCTSGVLLRMLVAQSTLPAFTHIVLDEVHERDKFMDFSLIYVKELVKRRPDIRVVLMSATLDSSLFISYFGNCPHINIPTKIYEVKEFYLDTVLEYVEYVPRAKKARAPPPSRKKEGTHVDKRLADQMGGAMEDAFLAAPAKADAALERMMFYILDKDVPIDYVHPASGCTPLMVAAAKGYEEIVMKLLRMGCDANIVAPNGWNAMAFAYHFGFEEIASLLSFESDSSPPTGKELLVSSYLANIDSERLDVDLIAQLIARLCVDVNTPHGAILVFLPGYDDIYQVNRLLETYGLGKGVLLLPLHSSFSAAEQRRVFDAPPKGVRKVILSTNIAETSLTINDVSIVVDCGRLKQLEFNETSRASVLALSWCSRASARQRLGRAGRTHSGVCYRLYTQARKDSFIEFQAAELLRSPLDRVCLEIKLSDPHADIKNFLARAIETPPLRLVDSAISLLKGMDAITEDEQLTTLGRTLALLPLSPAYAKMIVASVSLRCLEPVAIIACSLDYRSADLISIKRPGSSPRSGEVPSDHYRLYDMFVQWKAQVAVGKGNSWCFRNNLSEPVLLMIDRMAGDVVSLVSRLRLAPPSDIEKLNENSASWSTVKAAILTGLYPNLAYSTQNELFVTSTKGSARVEGKSLLPRPQLSKPGHWVVFSSLNRMYRSNVMSQCTSVSPFFVLLLCAQAQENISLSELEVDEPDAPVQQLLLLDEWIRLVSDGSSASLMLHLRRQWQNFFVESVEGRARKDSQWLSSFVSILLKNDHEPFQIPAHTFFSLSSTSSSQPRHSKIATKGPRSQRHPSLPTSEKKRDYHLASSSSDMPAGPSDDEINPTHEPLPPNNNVYSEPGQLSNGESALDSLFPKTTSVPESVRNEKKHRKKKSVEIVPAVTHVTEPTPADPPSKENEEVPPSHTPLESLDTSNQQDPCPPPQQQDPSIFLGNSDSSSNISSLPQTNYVPHYTHPFPTPQTNNNYVPYYNHPIQIPGFTPVYPNPALSSAFSFYPSGSGPFYHAPPVYPHSPSSPYVSPTFPTPASPNPAQLPVINPFAQNPRGFYLGNNGRKYPQYPRNPRP